MKDKVEVKVINAGVVKDVDELWNSLMTVDEFKQMRINSAIEKAKKSLGINNKEK